MKNPKIIALLGALLAGLVVFRLIWRKLNPPATRLDGMQLHVEAGSDISDVIGEMVESADECDCPVWTVFNGVHVEAAPGDSVRLVFDRYEAACVIQRARHEAEKTKAEKPE